MASSAFRLRISFASAEYLLLFASGYELRNLSPSDLSGAVCVSKPYTKDRLKDALSAALTKDVRCR
jgi:hypothetical protein